MKNNLASKIAEKFKGRKMKLGPEIKMPVMAKTSAAASGTKSSGKC